MDTLLVVLAVHLQVLGYFALRSYDRDCYTRNKMPPHSSISASRDYPFTSTAGQELFSSAESDQDNSRCCSSTSSESSSSHRELSHAPDRGLAQAPGKYFTQSSSSRLRIVHPYTRLLAKKDDTKRRRIWNHALEKFIFSPFELSTLGAPHRRTMYLASLEAHIDKLHAQLLEFDCCPVSAAELEPFRGLNSKTAKSMVSSLQHEVSVAKLKLLELERANRELECLLRSTKDGELPCKL